MSGFYANQINPSDYTKATMSQNQILKLQIANDKSISDARKAIKDPNYISPIAPYSNLTPEQLQENTGLQETDAVTNLLDLGFKYREVQTIITSLKADDIFAFNQAYPQVKRDITTRFNISTITATFFLEYLQQYLQQLSASKGLTSSSNLAYISSRIDQLIDTTGELKKLIPTRESFVSIGRAIHRIERELPSNNEHFFDPVTERIDAILSILPDAKFYADLDELKSSDPVRGRELLQEVLTAVRGLPTQSDIATVIAAVDEGRLSGRNAANRVEDLVSMVDQKMIFRLDEIRAELHARKPPQPQEHGDLPYILDNGVDKGQRIIVLESNKIDFRGERMSVAKFCKTLAFIENFAGVRKNIKAIREQVLIMTGGGKAVASVESESDSEMEIGPSEIIGRGLGRLRKTSNNGVKIGKGITVEREPQYKQFGKYVIDWGKLTKEDVLHIKYQCLGRIPNFKATPITEIFKDFLVELITTGKSNKRLYEQVPIDEKRLLEKMTTGAGIFHQVAVPRINAVTEDADEKRFEILRGEILAGNTSTNVSKEFREILIKFMGENRITKADGYKLLIEYCK